MRLICAAVAICALLLVGCGPDSELVASGKNHKCKLQDLAKKLEAEPDNAKILKEIKMTTEDLKAVVETVDEGKRDDLQTAIDQEFAKGCD